MASKWKITERIPLSTKAHDQAGRSYDVELQMDGYGHWVVALLGTPGSWRFETIKDVPDNLAISGFSWGWTNVAPVIAEAKEILEGLWCSINLEEHDLEASPSIQRQRLEPAASAR